MAADEAVPPAPAAPAQTSPDTKAADDAWKTMEKLQQPPEKKPTSRDEAIAQLTDWFGKQKEAAEDFAQKFPKDPRSWQARMIALRATMQTRRFTGDKGDVAADKKKLEEIVNAPDAPATVKGEAAFMEVILPLTSGEIAKADEATFTAFYKSVASYLQQYPDHPLAGQLKSIEMQVLDQDPTSVGMELLKRFSEGSDPRLVEAAKAIIAKKQKMADLKSKPVDLKFTAADGQPVDLANLRGKVVLVDFWASWCGPCMGEMPNVVKTYGSLHDKGFEIVGISLDQEKDAMEGALKSQHMTWPQYFDGGGWKNKFATEFGIQSIPAAWLIDKKGMLREMNLRGEALGTAVEKLLAE
jgi:thiol-disulfide isomerase/thioredoxin